MNPASTHSDSERVFDEFSPKKFFILFNKAKRYIFSKWIIILLVGIVFGIIGAYKAYSKKPIYTAEISFTLDEGSFETPKTEYVQLAQELGLPTMNTAGGVFNSITNILELMKSRLLIEKTLRGTVTVHNKTLVLGDFFLDSLNYRDKWMKGSRLYKKSIAIPSKNENDSLFKNSILGNMYETLLAKNLVINQKGTNTSIVEISCNSENELFSKYFLESLVNEVTSYYTEIKTQRVQNNVDFLQRRIDSIKTAYTGALYTKAAITDANVNPSKQIATVSPNKKQTDIDITKSTYVDLAGSLESARTLLMRETPLFQFIDKPILPLKMQKPDTLKYFILFFIIGSALIIFYLLVYKTIQFIIHN